MPAQCIIPRCRHVRGGFALLRSFFSGGMRHAQCVSGLTNWTQPLRVQASLGAPFQCSPDLLRDPRVKGLGGFGLRRCLQENQVAMGCKLGDKQEPRASKLMNCMNCCCHVCGPGQG